jgi:hypothetical protein
MNANFDNAILMDGGSSAMLMHKGRDVISMRGLKGAYKNAMQPVGIGVRVRH